MVRNVLIPFLGLKSVLRLVQTVTSANRSEGVLALCTCLLCGFLSLSAVKQTEYVVGPLDVLTITLFGQPDLSGKFTVGSDGQIGFPLLGTVKVAGLTARGIETLLTARLADGYLKNPQVSVEVMQFVSQRVFVMGEVRTPGSLPLTGELTLLEALAKAGGLTEYAGGDLQLLRGTAAGVGSGPAMPGGSGVTTVTRVSVRDLRSGVFPQNVPLKNGDTIFVPRAEVIYVLGQVNNPGSYTMEPGMTVLKAISLAGGVTQLGSTGRIKIIRIVGGKRTEIKAKLDALVQAGDTVTVGMRLF